MHNDSNNKVYAVARRKRRRRQFLGGAVLCLCLIGFATIITWSVQGIKSLMKSEDIQEDYLSLIAPLVSLDPASFPDIESADKDVLLESAIWASISFENTEKYPRDEEGRMLIPSVDVDRYLTNMYGNSLDIRHHSFVNYDLTFEYLSDSKSYVIPITSQSGSYFPRIDNEETSGNTKILTVAYMQYTGTAAEIVLDSSTQKVSKYMNYTLIRDNDSYHIFSVAESDIVPEEQ